MRGRAAAPQDDGGEWGLRSPTPCDKEIRRGWEDTSGAEGRGVAPHVLRRVQDDGVTGTYVAPHPAIKRVERGVKNVC